MLSVQGFAVVWCVLCFMEFDVCDLVRGNAYFPSHAVDDFCFEFVVWVR